MISGALCLAKVFLCFCQPFSCVDSVTQFLRGQLFARNIDYFEPVQLLFVCTLTNINHKGIVKNLFLFCLGQISKLAGHTVHYNGKFIGCILANADGSLLTVQHFKVAVIALYPIHNIQGKVAHDSMYYLIALFILINKFTLKSRSNIQLAAIPYNAVFCAVLVPRHDIAHRDFMQFNLHGHTAL